MKKYSPYLFVSIAVIVLLAPLLLTGRVVLWGTPALQFVPWWTYAWESIFSGEFPLWNPYNGMGAPLAANYQSALFYPPNWIYGVGYWIDGAVGIAHTIEFLLVGHILLAGFGMIVFLRRLGVKLTGQAVGSLSFALSGYVVSRAGFLSINAVLAWLPWLMALTTELAADSAKRRTIPRLGFITAMMLLAGHAQLSWYSLLLAGAWLVFLSVVQNIDDHRTWRDSLLQIFQKGWRFTAAILLGAAVSAVQLLPTASYLLQSQRAGSVEMASALVYSFWPYRFLSLFAPDMFGNPVRGDYWGYANYWEDAVYVGLLPMLVVLGILLRAVFRRRYFRDRQPGPVAEYHPRRLPTIGFFLVVIGLSFLLALGKNTPVFPFLYRYIPTFDMFQGPTRLSIWAVFSMAAVAGIGIEYWRKPDGRTLYWTRLGLAGSIAISIGLVIGWYVLSDVETTYIRALAMTSLFATVFCILRLLTPEDDWPGNRSHLWWKLIVVGFVAIDLIVAGWGLIPAKDTAFYQDEIRLAPEIEEQLGNGRLYYPVEAEEAIKYQKFFTFDGFDSEYAWPEMRRIALPNANLFDGIHVANNYDPILPGRYQQWVTALDGLPQQRRMEWYDLMNVSLVGSSVEDGEAVAEFTPVSTRGRVRYFSCAQRVEDGEQALEILAAGDVDLRTTFIIEAEPGAPIDRDCSETSRAVEVVDQGNNSLRIRVEAGSPGYVLVSDVWYPGWKAQSEKAELTIYRGNYLFKAVRVDETRQTIDFEYRPPIFLIGLIISIIAAIILTLLTTI